MLTKTLFGAVGTVASITLADVNQFTAIAAGAATFVFMVVQTVQAIRNPKPRWRR